MEKLDFELIFRRIINWKPTSRSSVEEEFLGLMWHSRFSCDSEEWSVKVAMVHRVYLDLVEGKKVGDGVVDQFYRLQACHIDEVFDCMDKIVWLNVLEDGDEDFPFVCAECYTNASNHPCRARL